MLFVVRMLVVLLLSVDYCLTVPLRVQSSKIRALIGCEPLSMFTNCDVLVTITTAAIDIVAETGEVCMRHTLLNFCNIVLQVNVT